MEKLEESFIKTLIILERNMLIIDRQNCVWKQTGKDCIRVVELCVHFLRERGREGGREDKNSLVKVGRLVAG